MFFNANNLDFGRAGCGLLRFFQFSTAPVSNSLSLFFWVSNPPLREKRQHTRFEWLAICAQWNWACFYCGDQIDIWTATKDHNIPVSRGGDDRIENIVPSCLACNQAKGTMTTEEFLASRKASLAFNFRGTNRRL